MLGLKLKWLVPLTFISYLSYTLFYICSINDPSKDILPDSCGLNYYTCLTANKYVKPLYLKSIDPFVQDNVVPFIESQIKEPFEKIDAKIGIKDKFSLGVRHLKQTDEKFKIIDKVKVPFLAIQSKLEVITSPLRERVTQKSLEFKELTNYKLLPKFDSYFVTIKSKFDLDKIKAQIYSFDIKKTISFLYEKVKEVYTLLLKKSNSEYLQEKTNFIKEDFIKLIKFNEIKSVSYEKTQAVLQVVKDILEEVTEENNDSENDESDYSDDETITVKLTSTISVTATSAPSELSTLTAEEIRLDRELYLWEQKVNRTLQLAEKSLSTEMSPIIDSIIDEIKPIISDKYQLFQSENYKTYRELNSFIVAINKDYESILSTNETVETVSRQAVRDSIAYSYKFSEDITDEVKAIISDKHSIILTEYYRVIQDTIDVLESFAETTIQEFSNKLSELINDLENNSAEFDEKLSWNSWKRFHKIKEEIYNFRNTIYNKANDYKNKESNVIPKGLEKWGEYLRNIDFHSTFLLRDNDDYLKLVRAKANIAFQLREGITRTLNKLKEENLKVKTEKDDIYQPEDISAANSESASEITVSQETENVKDTNTDIPQESDSTCEDDENSDDTEVEDADTASDDGTDVEASESSDDEEIN